MLLCFHTAEARLMFSVREKPATFYVFGFSVENFAGIWIAATVSVGRKEMTNLKKLQS